jgi:hypothetical protein
MPASIIVTTKEKKWLKKLIEEKYHLEISDSYSCKKLSAMLSEKAYLDINYNTIRRIFNVVQSKSNPSSYSLNILSKSIDFKDFEDFKKYIYKFDKDIFNELILLSFGQKQIQHHTVMEFVQDLTSPNWQEIYQLKNLIDLCIQIQDYEFLKQILHMNFNLENEEFLEKFAVCFQSLYFETKNKNIALHHFVLQNISTSEILQRILLQVYISENNLNDFWGDWLEAASIDKVNDMEVFKCVLLCQKKYNNNLISEAKELLKIAKNAVAIANLYIHPILLGRIAAWEIILNSNIDTPPLYFNNLSNSFEKSCYFIFYNRLLLLYNKEFHRGIVESIDLSRLPLMLGAFDKKLLNKFYLSSALYYHHISAHEKAKLALINVDENRLDIWEIDWFYEKFKLLNKIYN